MTKPQCPFCGSEKFEPGGGAWVHTTNGCHLDGFGFQNEQWQKRPEGQEELKTNGLGSMKSLQESILFLRANNLMRE